MGAVLQGVRGGILGLSSLIDQYGEALRADLLKVGLTLDAVGTKKLGWHDLLAFVKDTRAGSALAIALHGERARWTDREYLMAMMVDALNGANWQRTGKRSGRPKPVVRPGQVSAGEAQHIGDGALPVDEFDIWLADKQAEATPDDENQQSVGGGSLMEPSPTLPQVDVTTPESGSLQR